MTQQARDQLGRFGIWRGEGQVTPELAVSIEELGFGALWLGSATGDLAAAEEFLAATTTLIVATGIVNMWQYEPHQVAASFRRVEDRFAGRFLLGVGAGHPEVTQQYAQPYDTLSRYVDTLLADGVPAGSLVLAALGPKVLRLAAERTAGAHPYLVTPDYTRQAREILGPGPLLAPEQKVVVSPDAGQARAIGRSRVEQPYLGLANYTANLRRLGWTDADLSGWRERRPDRRAGRPRQRRPGGGAPHRAPRRRGGPREHPAAHPARRRPGRGLPGASRGPRAPLSQGGPSWAAWRAPPGRKRPPPPGARRPGSLRRCAGCSSQTGRYRP